MRHSIYLMGALSQEALGPRAKRDPVFGRHKRGGVAPGAGVKSIAPTKPVAEPRPGVPVCF